MLRPATSRAARSNCNVATSHVAMFKGAAPAQAVEAKLPTLRGDAQDLGRSTTFGRDKAPGGG